MKLTVGKGMEKYLEQLTTLYQAAPDQIGRAVYEGAKIVADAIKANINAIPTDEKRASEGQKRSGISKIQKIGLEKGFGISKMRDSNGYLNVKIGFHGYNRLKTKKYPQGQPNAMIAATLEAGSSYTQKKPFVGPAVRKTRKPAEEKMADVIDSEISKVTK